ncbi:MAG: hypothetical protein DI568_13135 [Sphingomonas sp.]|nr:MAG: hypothetical protein DI568_13135 [Sphingomonas sp.]
MVLAFMGMQWAVNAQSEPPSGLIVEKNGPFTNLRVAGVEDQGKFKEIRSRPLDDAATLKLLTDGRNELPTPYLFELSRRLLASKPREAVRWYLIALARLRYDAFRCTDRSVYLDGGFLLKWRQMYPEVPEWVQANVAKEEAPKMDVRDDPELFSGTANPLYACGHGMAAIGAATRGEAVDSAKALRPEVEWEPIRAWLAGKRPKPDFI